MKKNIIRVFLTLLPRLIAQIDPSIPIIIFSSTGQRSIIDKFNDYANIITCFEKPRVLGYRSDDAGLIRHNFETAIKQAMQFIKVRRRLRSIISMTKKAHDVRVLPDEPSTGESSKGKYIELYIDETGVPGDEKKKKFAIGGIYAIYKDKEQADQFNCMLADEGVYYFERPDFTIEDEWWSYPQKKVEFKTVNKDNLSENKSLNLKDAERKPNAKFFENTLNKLQDGKKIFGNILYEEIKLIHPKNINKYNKYPYALNISMLRCLIELFLYEVLPEKKVDPAAKIAIYVATRVQEHDKQEAETEKYHSGRGYLEYGEDNKKYLTYYIGSDTPHTLMEEVFHLHSDEESDDKVHRLLGVTLVSRKSMKPQWEFVKVTHGLPEEEYKTIKFSNKYSKKKEEEIKEFCKPYPGKKVKIKISPLPRSNALYGRCCSKQNYLSR